MVSVGTLLFLTLSFALLNYQFINAVSNTPDFYNPIRYTAFLAIWSLIFFGATCVLWMMSAVSTYDLYGTNATIGIRGLVPMCG